MKKLLFSLLLLTVAIFAFASCGENGNITDDGHEHAVSDTTTVEATCTSEGARIMLCSCGEELERETIPMIAHTEVEFAETAATCTEAGKTEGTKCSVCNTVISGGEAIEATGHDYRDLPEKAPTCVEVGYTAGKRCVNCDDSLEGGEEIPATGIHTSEQIPAVEPTCVAVGNTRGEKCSVCNEILTPTEEIPATGEHTYDNGTIQQQPAFEVEGSILYTCTVCQTTKTEAIPALTYRPEDIWDGSSREVYESGSGTEDDPYIIANAKQLYYMASYTSEADGGKYFKLKNDIILNDIANYENWGTQAPANKWNTISFFKGHFDGNGYAIRGLYHKVTTDSNGSNPYHGLFGQVRGSSSIKNLTVSEAYVYSVETTGGIAARMDNSSYNASVIDNCHFSGKLYGYHVGGIVGVSQVGSKQYGSDPVYGSVTISNCTSRGIIRSSKTWRGDDHYAAGVLSYAYLYDGNLQIQNCTNYADVTSYAGGGIFGVNSNTNLSQNQFYFTISGCTNEGKITASGDNGTIGGIVSQLTGSNVHNVVIKNCTNRGEVSGGSYLGGIAGRLTLSDLYDGVSYTGINNYGNVSTSAANCCAGGMFGYLYLRANISYYTYKLTLNNSLSEGTVTGSGDYVGEFVGMGEEYLNTPA